MIAETAARVLPVTQRFTFRQMVKALTLLLPQALDLRPDFNVDSSALKRLTCPEGSIVH